MTVSELSILLESHPELGERPVLLLLTLWPSDAWHGDKRPVAIAFDADGALVVRLAS